MSSTISLTLTPSQKAWLKATAQAAKTSPEDLLIGLLERERKHASVPAVQVDLFASATVHEEPPPAASKASGWKLWSDGACSGNPGPGGWGALIEGPDGRQELSGGYRSTTNNRMELMGAISALEAIPHDAEATLTTDSRYLVDALEKRWLAGWKRKGWRKADGGPVANVDLWQRLEAAMSGKTVKLEWVRGHNGHPQNERCDHLAVAAAHKPGLPTEPSV